MKTQYNLSDSYPALFRHPNWSIASGDYIPKVEEHAPSHLQFRLVENMAYSMFLLTFFIGVTSLTAALILLV